MSCGSKITPRFDSFWEREKLSRKLEREGEYRLADAIKHGGCLDRGDLYRAESALDRQGLHRDFDYREERCICRAEDEDKG